jgi:uncharacterized membrane-anchored protein
MTKRTLLKVPEISAIFWVIKVLTTAGGEATSDYLVHTLARPVAVAIGGTAFIVALALQFSAKKYVAWTYWLAVSMVAVFGTMCADAMHVGLGIPYAISTAFFAVSLAVIFTVWHATEGTLSIHSVYTPRRELFYWATVCATFALGTALGDLTAYTMGIGWLASAVMFTVLITIPAVGYLRLSWNAVFAFWFAYVLTRPLGASYADWLGVEKSLGGLGFGRGPVAVVFALAIVAMVAYQTVTGRDVPADQKVSPRQREAVSEVLR